jgi:outer membrane protein insertion porin family
MTRLSVIPLWIAVAGLSSSAQPALILSISFQGNQKIDSAQLKSKMRLCREGNSYSPEALRFELNEVEQYYRDNGFLKAEVGPPSIENRYVQGRGHGVVIQIPVTEGPLFRLGQIIIKNANVVSPATLLQMSPVRPGEPYNRGMMMEWVNRMRGSYHEIGYIRFDANLREDTNVAERTVDCVLELQEGGEYRVGKITVAGGAVDMAELRKLLLVSEGSVYNPGMLFTSTYYINLRRQYQPFGPSDVEVRIDDGRKTVDLVFHIVPLKKPESGGGPTPPSRS